MSVCCYEVISTSLRLNISETKRDSGLFPIRAYWKVPKGSQMVLLQMMSHDSMTS